MTTPSIMACEACTVHSYSRPGSIPTPTESARLVPSALPLVATDARTSRIGRSGPVSSFCAAGKAQMAPSLDRIETAHASVGRRMDACSGRVTSISRIINRATTRHAHPPCHRRRIGRHHPEGRPGRKSSRHCHDESPAQEFPRRAIFLRLRRSAGWVHSQARRR
jgi:hypothetical protein